MFLPLKNSWHYAVPLNNIHSLYISYLHVWCCLLLPTSCGHCLGGRWGQSGAILGNGGRSASSVWVSGIWALGVLLRLVSAVCSVFCTHLSSPASEPLPVPCPPLLWSSPLPPVCLTVGPDQKPLLPRCPPPPHKHWSSAGCVCCCWKPVPPLTTNPHCSPAYFQTLEEGPLVV